MQSAVKLAVCASVRPRGRKCKKARERRFSALLKACPGRSLPTAKSCPACRSGPAGQRRQRPSDAFVLLIGRPVMVLQSWLERARITEGAAFRGIDRWGDLEKTLP